jgi:hypothetical protein
LASLAAALFLCPLSEWDHGILHRNRLGLRLKEKFFYQMDDESLTPIFFKQFHKGTQSGQTVLETTLAQHFYVPKLSSISKTV